VRVLVWGINYHPEQVGIAPYNTALCESLTREGHDVEMVSTFAYYPMWKKAAGDRWRLFRSDTIGGVPVHRCWHFVPRRPSGLRRIVHEASFVVTSTLRMLMLKRADVMVVVSPPLLLGAAAWLVGLLKGAPHVLHIQDLQPDAAVGLGMLDRPWLIGLLRWLERFNYWTAARVSVNSEGMFRALTERGVERLVYFPNWVLTNTTEVKQGAFRKARGIGSDEFVLLYSGNIGIKQGLELIVEAAVRVKEIRLIICGDGAARPALEELIAARGALNVTLLPLQEEEDYQRMMADADVCVISQRGGTGVAFFPSKLLSCAAFGKPVLAVTDRDSELARVVMEETLGLWVERRDVEEVAEAMRGLRGSRAILNEWGRNGRGYAARFEEERVLRDFDGVLEELAEPMRTSVERPVQEPALAMLPRAVRREQDVPCRPKHDDQVEKRRPVLDVKHV
jgi:colanic acid biosynthesis glycosyl transferase WcaI